MLILGIIIGIATTILVIQSAKILNDTHVSLWRQKDSRTILALLDRVEAYETALKELVLNHEHQAGLEHTRAMGDSYGWCDFCQTKVSWGGDDPAHEVLKRFEGDV